jgi:hypothetical protein
MHEDKLDRLLRADAARDAIADEGFTARVIAALPPAPVRAPRPWLTPLLVAGSAALGSALAVAFAPEGGGLLQGYVDLIHQRAATPAAITSLAVMGALALSALVLAVDAE